MFRFNLEDKLEIIFAKIIQKSQENKMFLKENVLKEQLGEIFEKTSKLDLD